MKANAILTAKESKQTEQIRVIFNSERVYMPRANLSISPSDLRVSRSLSRLEANIHAAFNRSNRSISAYLVKERHGVSLTLALIAFGRD